MMEWKEELQQHTKEAEKVVQGYLPEETGHQKLLIEASNSHLEFTTPVIKRQVSHLPLDTFCIIVRIRNIFSFCFTFVESL